MKRQLRWTERATAESAAIAEYVSITSPVYAEQLLEAFSRHLRLAIDHPESGRVVPELSDPVIREFIEGSYRLMYRIESEAIHVIAVVHGRRDFRAVL